MSIVNGTAPVGIRAQKARIDEALASRRTLVFGNIQGNPFGLKAAVKYAITEGIQTIVTLGRFTRGDCMGLHGERPEQYLDHYRALLHWVNGAPEERIWLGIIGKYDYMPDGRDVPEILQHMTFDGTRNNPIGIFQGAGLIFAHFSNTLYEAYKANGFMPCKDGPTVLFFSHSYYMGINEGKKPISPGDDAKGPFQIGEIRRQDEETPSIVHLPPYEVEHQLIPGKTYWVSTGGNFLNGGYNEFRDDRNQYVLQVANFAVYDPNKRVLTLKSLSEWELYWRAH